MNTKVTGKFRSLFTLFTVALFLFTSLGFSIGTAIAQDSSSNTPSSQLDPVEPPAYLEAPYLSEEGLTLYNSVTPLVIVTDPDPKMQGLKFAQSPEVAAAIADPSAATATFTINYIAAGGADLWGEPCFAFPASAKTAFNAAAAIWASTIQSAVPVTISACWATLASPDILGYSGGQPLHRDFTGAPRAGTWFQASLANSLKGSDLDPSSYDMNITYNSSFSWYYGTDGNPPAGTYDLVTVAAHEIAHGLNFSGSAKYTEGTGIGEYKYSGYPVVYDTFMENLSGQKLSTYTNPSTALGSLFTSSSLWFNGTNANAANGGTRVKMYAPGPWSGGSSYSHLDYTTYAGTANNMMVYAVSPGAAQHNPGNITKGLLKDLGWPTGAPSPVPTPQSPSGTIYDTTPTYSWSMVTGATQYEFQLNNAATSALVYDKIADSTACSGATCTRTPGTVLPLANYKWRVRAYVGGAWKTWSAYKNFTIAAPVAGFNSTFNSDASGWTPLNGSWYPASGFYQVTGIANNFVTSKHSDNYSVFTYSVRMKATGCSTCAHGIFFNGSPSPITTVGYWNNGYSFRITNNGSFLIGRYNGGVFTYLIPDWTSSSAITSIWNTLKVTYNNSTGYVQFFINGTSVATGYFNTYKSGKVGVGMYTDATISRLKVDSATLTMSAPSAIIGSAQGIVIDEVNIPDQGNPGTSDQQAP
jgi:hypothetical protein